MLLSVMIPAYNCADTLTQAVESAVNNQSVPLEILIVDDGSRDDTPAVISALSEKYEIVRAIRTGNGGPAKARNCGIENAKGDYILFLDSDDVFEQDAIEAIAGNLTGDEDLLIFGFRQTFCGRAEDKIYSLNEPFSTDLYYRHNLLNQVWNKAYKRDFLEKNAVRFRDYRYGEDRLFNAEVLRAEPTVKAIPDVLYDYRIDKSVSLISGYIPEKFEACKMIYREFSALCENKNVPKYMFLKNILSCMTVLFADNCPLSKKEKKAKIEKILTDETVQTAMEAKQSGKANEVIRRVIRTGNIGLNYRFAQTVAFCQKKFLPLFLKFRG